MTAAFLAGVALLSAISDPESLRPDTILRPPDGPTVAFVEATGSPAAAIRITVPFVESDSDAGAGYLIQLLALERVRRFREMLGIEVLAHRTSSGLVYRLNGAVADFDQLAGVARELVARPVSPGFVAARTRLERMNREERETARGTLRFRLRSRMASPIPSVTGSLASLAALHPARLVERWRASHRRGNLSVVVVADLPLEAVFSALSELGEAGPAPETGGLPEAATRRSTAPRPERIRTWYGAAYPSGSARDPRSALLAHLANDHLQEFGGEFEPHLERWELGERSWLVLTAAAFSRNATTMRARIRGYIGDLRAALSPTVVRHARSSLRSELLLETRSPAGLAEVIGRHLDATGDADGARDYLRRLEEIDFEDMAAFLEEIAATEAITAEVGD